MPGRCRGTGSTAGSKNSVQLVPFQVRQLKGKIADIARSQDATDAPGLQTSMASGRLRIRKTVMGQRWKHDRLIFASELSHVELMEHTLNQSSTIPERKTWDASTCEIERVEKERVQLYYKSTAHKSTF